MGYRIFYSYQSDISKKLNLIFIRDAINAAIKKIKHHKIEPLIEGFYGIGGNPPLVEAMLKQSQGTDIFIGDVTFTSSKIWQSQGVNFHEDAKTYLIEIEKPTDLKPAPNPNVLLETGYSWALKTFNRTILVMNEAFGSPSQLPVDMKGLRWPITYNLSEDRFDKKSKFNKEFEQLTDAFEFAINDAINSSIEYQESLLSPFQLYYAWEKESRNDFILTKKIEKIISEIRAQVIQDNKPIRIVGPAKSGKSRILFEIFRKNGSLEAMPEQLNRIIYHDFTGAMEGDISKQIDRLRILEQSKILIIDNCPTNKIQAYENHFNETNVKLITLNNTPQHADNEYEISKADAIEISREILVTKFPYNKAEELAYELDGNIRRVIQNLGENVSLEGEVSSLELIKQEIGQGNVDKGAIELLTNISLFKYLGVQNGYELELHAFMKTLYPSAKMEVVNSIIEVLLDHNLIIRKGDFVQVQIDEEELVYEWWKNIDSKKIDNIHGLENDRLLYRFFEQLHKTNKSSPIPSLEHNLFGPDKFFTKNDFFSTQIGQKFLNDLASIFPEQVLELSALIVNGLLE